uniref:Syntaxin N-terminal domain-containing protein n=1 Tax=Anopheles minimus TaxID=112268 RepID=A0A182VUK0_9DIPT
MLAMHHMTPVEVTQISNLHTITHRRNHPASLSGKVVLSKPYTTVPHRTLTVASGWLLNETTATAKELNSVTHLILEINSEVALFRDLLIHVGQSRDCPELREKIRKLRRSCVEACKHTAALILPQIRT